MSFNADNEFLLKSRLDGDRKKLQQIIEQYEFEYVSCEGDGEDEGYEPKIRKGW